MSQDSEMKQFRSEKSLMKFFFFKTILSDFALERGPFLKCVKSNLSFYKGHLGERGKSVAVVDGWVETRVNTVYDLRQGFLPQKIVQPRV